MIDVAFQSMIRAALVNDPMITRHVEPHRIRAGLIRPEHFPAIMLTPARIEILGRASNRQIVAEIGMQVHVWAIADGSEAAQQIAGAVMRRLLDAPRAEGLRIDEWERPALVWSRDPDPALTATHGVIGLNATVRWKVEA